VAPERIELTSSLGVEGLAPVSTSPAVQGQSAASSGEGKEREHNPRRRTRPADEEPAEILELSGNYTADEDREPEPERRQDQDQDHQNQDGLAPHRLDSLA
jgi:hypothetical protein